MALKTVRRIDAIFDIERERHADQQAEAIPAVDLDTQKMLSAQAA